MILRRPGAYFFPGMISCLLWAAHIRSASSTATWLSTTSMPKTRSAMVGNINGDGTDSTKETTPLVNRTKISLDGIAPHIEQIT